MKKTNLIILLACLFLISCNQLENKLEGTWAIDQAYYHDEPVRWDLYTNALGLNENNTCNLPPINSRPKRTPNEEKGTWQAFEEKDKAYLEIDTENRIFDRTFEVHNLRKVQDSVSLGYLMKMTLVADSLKLDCTKALY